MATRVERPAGGWTELIDDVLAGRWTNPETGKIARVPYESIVIGESLDGAEADLVASLKLGDSFVVVSDTATQDAMGARVAHALRALGPVREVVLDHPHADMGAVADLTETLSGAEAVIS